MFSKKVFLKILFVIVVGLFSSILYAENKPVTVVTRSSAIPDKREFPVDPTINPCVNFYAYACNTVINSFQLREDRSHHTFSFSDSSERLLEFKKKYFLNLAKKKPETAMEGEIKNYYVACMDESGRKKEELALVQQTKEILEKITTKEQFLSMIAENITSGSHLSFVDFSTDANLDKPEYNDLFFDSHLMSLPERSYYQNSKLTKDLKELMRQFFITIGDKSSTKKANLVFNFEKALAQVYPTPPQVQERMFSRTKISRTALVKNYPHLKLEKFLSDIPQHVVIRNVLGNDTMAWLNRKLKTASLDELKSVFLYFQLKSIMDDAYPDFFNKKFEFNKKYLGGPNKRPERQERCTRSVMSDFEKELDYTLLPKMFPNFPKEEFKKSIEKIRISLIDQLSENKWLSKGAKSEAIRKIKKAKLALVSPDNDADWDFHPLAVYNLDQPIANSYKLAKILIDKQLGELKGPVNTNRWNMGPLTVNANYSPFYNRFEFPVGILQYPFYDPNELEEVNLAAIGAVIGHELGHAIDDHGSSFNADGVFKEWMLNKDKKMFHKRSHYLIKQFDKIGHNGKFTLGENIGDLVGVTTAYRAAFPQGVDKGSELKKKFFLQYARLWCGVERPGITQMRLKTDPHALEQARTNEQVKQQAGFCEAYGCKPSDPMVLPENERVKIW